MSIAPQGHYETVVKAIIEGRVVPFLGAGINLCSRPARKKWRQGQSDYLPSNSELATHLEKTFGVPADEPENLVRVSQYIADTVGTRPLYEELRKLFGGEFPPTILHHFFARFTTTLRAKGFAPPHQLIVTTNYDDLLERAFDAVQEPYDVVSYVADGEHAGRFLHRPPNGALRLIEKPNEYRDLSLDQRTVILKIQGAIDHNTPEGGSFVITEDHYINFLTRTDISNLVPVTLAAKLRKSHFLFLGYNLRDWNLRIILHRIWGEQRLTYKSWSVQSKPLEIEQRFWMKRDVDVIEVSLEDYIAELSDRLQAQLSSGDGHEPK
ncbi:MAG TPA: SIR2 family protein [Anaerolineae bacterium]